MALKHAFLIIAALVLAPPFVAAQPLRSAIRDTATVTEDAPIRVVPDTSRQPLRVAAKGTVLSVVRTAPQGWVEVVFQDPQFGVRQGFIEAKFIRMADPALAPMDLSVPAAQAPSPAQPAPQVAQTQSAQRPELPSKPATIRRAPDRLFVTFDLLGYFPNQGEVVGTFIQPRFGEPMTSAVAYSKLPSVMGVIGGVDVALSRSWLVGVRFVKPRYVQPVGLAVDVPHPLFVNRYGSDVGVTTFSRDDTTIDFSVSLLRNGPRVVTKATFGPTYFHVSHEFVSQINFLQSATLNGGNTILITAAPTTEVKGSGFGIHFGGDVSYFIWRNVGVGGGALFNYGRVSLDDPFTGEKAKLHTGGLTLQGGARFRF